MDWVQGILFASVPCALFALFGVLRYFNQHDKRHDAIEATLAVLVAGQARIDKELHPNGGSSVRDAIDRTAKALGDLRTQQDKADERGDRLAVDIATIRGRLQQQDIDRKQ